MNKKTCENTMRIFQYSFFGRGNVRVAQSSTDNIRGSMMILDEQTCAEMIVK